MTKSASLFTPSEREAVLAAILGELEADSRVAAAVIVGSAAYGFKDEFSDIDLSVALARVEDIEPVFREWRDRINKITQVSRHFETRYSSVSLLHGFLTDTFLEIDVGFVCLDNLAAKREHWKVAFNRTASVEEILKRTWANRPEPDVAARYAELISGSWHLITHVAILARRGEPLRAVHYLEELRNRAVELAGLRLGMETGNFREVDSFPADLRLNLRESYPGNLEEEEIFRALHVTTGLFFREAKRLERIHGFVYLNGLDRKMRAYITAVKNIAHAPPASRSPRAR